MKRNEISNSSSSELTVTLEPALITPWSLKNSFLTATSCFHETETQGLKTAIATSNQIDSAGPPADQVTQNTTDPQYVQIPSGWKSLWLC